MSRVLTGWCYVEALSAYGPGDVFPTITAPCYALTDDGSRAGGGPRSCRCSCSRFRPKLAAQLSHTTTDQPRCHMAGQVPASRKRVDRLTTRRETVDLGSVLPLETVIWMFGFQLLPYPPHLPSPHPIPHIALLPPSPLTLASVDLFAPWQALFSSLSSLTSPTRRDRPAFHSFFLSSAARLFFHGYSTAVSSSHLPTMRPTEGC